VSVGKQNLDKTRGISPTNMKGHVIFGGMDF